jgi:small subunit ribosomal protein S4
MARYIGPKIKISRRFGQKLGLRSNEEGFTRRPSKPGEHGSKNRRGRVSEYGMQLMEKQKAKAIYGVLEKQFHRYYTVASKDQNVGLALLQILETRLDTVVFRAGFAATQQQARQFVSHGHVTVDGQKITVASMLLKPGQKVTVLDSVKKVMEESPRQQVEPPAWLKTKGTTVEVLALPERDQITNLINEQMIVEYYSR